jgi:CHAD domain-containing protein
MAKALPIPQIKPDKPVAGCLPAIVETRIGEIVSFRQQVVKGSTDAVHDMRVAGRRLQTVLMVFSELIPKNKVLKFKKRLRRLTRRLGTVRQYDVLVEVFSSAIKCSDDKQLTVRNLLLARYSTSRKEAHDNLLNLLEEIEESDIFRRFIGSVNTSQALGMKKAYRNIEKFSFAEKMRDSIGDLVGDFSSGVTRALRHEDSVEILHEMRIAGKPLRYAMELAEPCFPEGFNEYFLEIKKTIQLIGDIHDIDLAVNTLHSFGAELRSYNEVAGRVIDHFPVGFLDTATGKLEADRKKLLSEIRAILLEWRQDKFFMKLLALLQGGNRFPAPKSIRAGKRK